MNQAAPLRLSRRGLGYLAGGALAAAAFDSRLPDEIAQRWALPKGWTSSRSRCYTLGSAWLRSAESYATVTRSKPAGNLVLPLFCSSEASVQVEQNPSSLLSTHCRDVDLLFRGHALHQDLTHAINLASMSDQLSPRRAAVVVSAQWFGPGGMVPRQFQSVFSGSQFLRMRNTRRISSATRELLMDRAASLGIDPLWLDGTAHGRSVLHRPVDHLLRESRALQEVSDGAQYVAGQNGHWEVPVNAQLAVDIPWEQLAVEATAQANRAISNDFNCDDGYFAQHLAQHLDELKGSLAHLDYAADGPEWTDLELLLRVARESEVELMVVVQPFNGLWYEFTGYPRQRRERYYERLRRLVRAHGMPLMDMSGHELEHGFMHDPTHFGWKGWLDVTRGLTTFATA